MFPPVSGRNRGSLLIIVLEILDCSQTRNRIKNKKIVFFFTDDIIIYVENSVKFIKRY